jgi:hypothetical protein
MPNHGKSPKVRLLVQVWTGESRDIPINPSFLPRLKTPHHIRVFLERVFEGISGYWANTKYSPIPKPLGDENTREVNKALGRFGFFKNSNLGNINRVHFFLKKGKFSLDRSPDIALLIVY